MSKNDSNNNIPMILSIGSVIAVGIMLKMVMGMKANSGVDQAGAIEELRGEISEIRKIIDSGAHVAPPVVAPMEAATENPYLKAKKEINMPESFFCQDENDQSHSIVHFDGKGNFKAWADTNGTIEYAKNQPPSWVGSYILSGSNLFMRMKKDGKGPDINRKATVVGINEEGQVTELEYYSNIFTSLACPTSQMPKK